MIFILLKSLPIEKFPLSLKGDSATPVLLKDGSNGKDIADLLKEDISHFLKSKLPDFSSEDVVSYISTISVPDLSTMFGYKKSTQLVLPESELHFRIIFYAPDEFVNGYLKNPLSIQANKTVYKKFITTTGAFEEDPIVSKTIYFFYE